ncbi:MAG: heptosyltransferase [Sphingomonadales bacterium]|nr:heptosyltransferase [Sphingomonadales bacterium]
MLSPSPASRTGAGRFPLLGEDDTVNSSGGVATSASKDEAPILIVPYMWIGDFVRCHSVVGLLRQRFPGRPVDMLANTTVAPLVDYMPGVRKAVVVDLPRKRLPPLLYYRLAGRLRSERYGQVLVMPRTWKAALAPFLAGIPLRTGFAGEARFGLINDMRWGERALPRMVDRCAVLALPKGHDLPPAWPQPELAVTTLEVSRWRERLGVAGDRSPIVALAPGAVGPAKRWPMESYAELARCLAAEGARVWVLGGPGERDIAAQIVAAAPTAVRDLTGSDLRNAVLAVAAADLAVSNDSGLLHVAAALGRPTIGIFGPTSPWHWAPLNPLADVIEIAGELPCRPCHKPRCRLGHHQCMRDIAVERLMQAVRGVLSGSRSSP